MNKLPFGCVLAAALITLAGQASAQEERIARSALPPAVEKAVVANTTGATIKGFTEEKEKDQTYYEAEMTVAGHTKDILFDTAGAIVEVEEQVALESLPSAVRAGLESKANGGTITKVESLTKHGQLVAYEANLTTKGKRSEIQVGPTGGPLPHEE